MNATDKDIKSFQLLATLVAQPFFDYQFNYAYTIKNTGMFCCWDIRDLAGGFVWFPGKLDPRK